jgi:hypothetical protein
VTVVKAFLVLAACLPLVSSASSLAIGTAIAVRMDTKVTSGAKAGDKVEAVVIAPVLIGDRVFLPQGARVAGAVKSATPAKPDARADLLLEFTELTLPGGSKMPLSAKISGLDNARESVTGDGLIQGILGTETLTSRMDQGLEKLGAKYARFADFLGAVKGAVLQKADTEITLEQGAELELALTAALDLAEVSPIEKVTPIEPAAELAALVDAIPFQTTAEKPAKPSDVTNLMYIGTREQIEAAFQAAGWATAAQLDAVSGLETVRAVAEQRGYKEAPMSTLLLEGRPPEMVYQKQYNTFAKRHHLRIFQRPEKFQGREVWVCAATHDTGIDFSPENRTFIHKIDSQIDHERAKVVFDLMFADKVKAVALVERPKVPTAGENATGDKIETDGKMAVLLLR